MSFAFIAMTMLLGSSVVIAFILQPPKGQAEAEDSHHRCQGESLQSVRKSLLSHLNLQAEPQLPVSVLDSVRAQWKTTFSTISHGAATDIAETSGYSVSPDGNSTNPGCCSTATEIFMKELFLLFDRSGLGQLGDPSQQPYLVQCAMCNRDTNTVQCPSPQPDDHKPSLQIPVPCCQPTAKKMVPILYMDEFNALVISSVQLTHSCGCGPGNIQQPGEE
ncbi:hypothetical protein Q5P01_024847 [Channa striata]|uniref:TGF-beta family profile domain-containing protein n=1 Tax=Channa striata TaxID=64152 RepID=A0AA88ISB1_CHASR|nr:hypothetical protein Q5P01_024847 [Channa striata]